MKSKVQLQILKRTKKSAIIANMLNVVQYLERNEIRWKERALVKVNSRPTLKKV